MREMKCRGIAVNGDFVYGWVSYDLPNSTAYYKDYSQRICWHPKSGGSSNAAVKNGTVGQYTGLKDANGKEIYVGDVVKCTKTYGHKSSSRYVVRFGHGMYMIAADNPDGYSPLADSTESVFVDVEVIGNIYENPELLEVHDVEVDKG